MQVMGSPVTFADLDTFTLDQPSLRASWSEGAVPGPHFHASRWPLPAALITVYSVLGSPNIWSVSRAKRQALNPRPRFRAVGTTRLASFCPGGQDQTVHSPSSEVVANIGPVDLGATSMSFTPLSSSFAASRVTMNSLLIVIFGYSQMSTRPSSRPIMMVSPLSPAKLTQLAPTSLKEPWMAAVSFSLMATVTFSWLPSLVSSTTTSTMRQPPTPAIDTTAALPPGCISNL
mmetsp:Transcript_24822/g.69178  ORF Transcript_24822/g.69178 Transcript_24822/m.69178 type:complete len:231 (+) Transcript_24822:434-1126(+)